jgi:ATP-binding cassette subfamily F protein 3
VGPNGVGKTTLLRTLMGEQKALKGKLRLGARVKLRYYDQHLGDLDPAKTVVEELQSAHPLPAEAARNFLARLLFTGDDAFKRVASLSGGEKSRLALAKLMLDNANLLLLDEPTNHLDIPSQEVLEEALGDYAGTIVFVSHDRYFIDRIATAVWRLEADGLRAYSGNYTDSQKIRARQDAVAPAPPKAAPASAAPGKSRDARERTTAQLEQEIEALEQRLGTIEQALADGRTYDQAARVAQLTQEFEAVSQTLQDRYHAWEELANPA